MAERAYPEDPAYKNKTKYYDALVERYNFGKQYTKNKIILDIPCGSGYGSSFIQNSKEIYGVDISKEAIEYARQHYTGHFVVGSMTNIPFSDNFFDTILCFEGMEHISKEDGILFINEVKRVLKNDGMFVGSVPILNIYGEDTGNPYHIFEYPQSYLKILLKNNFKLITFKKAKGGDGPIVYFAAKNTKKNIISVISTQFSSQIDFLNKLKTLNKQIFFINDKNSSLIVNDNYKKNFSIVKIINYDFNKEIGITLQILKFFDRKFIPFFKKSLKLIIPKFILNKIRRKK